MKVIVFQQPPWSIAFPVFTGISGVKFKGEVFESWGLDAWVVNFGRCGFSGFKVCGSPTSAKWWHIPVCDLAPEPEWIVTCSEGGDQFKHVCILMVGRRHLPMAAMWIVVWDTRTCHVSRILVDVGHAFMD